MQVLTNDLIIIYHKLQILWNDLNFQISLKQQEICNDSNLCNLDRNISLLHIYLFLLVTKLISAWLSAVKSPESRSPVTLKKGKESHFHYWYQFTAG